MVKIFDAISRIGVGDDFSPKKVREYQLANVYTAVATTVMLVNVLGFLFFEMYPGAAACGLAFLSLVASFRFTQKQQIRIGEIIALGSIGFGIISVVTLYGQHYWSQLYFVLLIVAYFVTFGGRFKKERNLLVFVTLALFIGSFFMGHGIYGTEADVFQETIISAANIFMVVIVMFIFFYAAVESNRATFNKLQEITKNADDERLTKSEFLSVMSHEIRTPLNAILGVGHLLAQTKSKHEIDENLKILNTSANQLLLLVNDILDFNKLEAGKIELYKNQVNLKELIHNTFMMFAHKAKAKGLEYIFECDRELSEFFYLDGSRLNQVISNLISNAIKFSDKGLVKVLIYVTKTEENHQVVKFEVLDTGIGISEDRQSKLFKIFTQAGAEVASQYGGTGLGLAISQKILALMGSEIKLESNQNIGSKFSFEVKLEKIDIQREPNKEQEIIDVKRIAGVRVLMAEDNMINQKIMAKFCEKWELDLTIVNNGKEAVESLELNDYDLILMDVQMPVMDGIEATQIIRNSSMPFSEIPIVALTADVTSETKDKVFSSGFNAYITKPFVPQKLIETIYQYRK